MCCRVLVAVKGSLFRPVVRKGSLAAVSALLLLAMAAQQ